MRAGIVAQFRKMFDGASNAAANMCNGTFDGTSNNTPPKWGVYLHTCKWPKK